uniref:Uncharacterized protein n=1 Tax=Chromera velia CCMP2878 TaxID=1169474 RepID=A0A0G4HMT1_9ALVE|eukprot:Cvel_29249.t1-p1 / transcript=Cvel_29249.t1 / gene=Cvel_29249 / organism=Chromera_velia_CCMP2878 / gene_product=hypothetical protein / transcript_product=hypothetical protein / location=Cvel_scaffold3965:6520-7126(-) / protein_length=169 / sequence_SO=supercontig / SO=protein_coding / is_pseudo=false
MVISVLQEVMLPPEAVCLGKPIDPAMLLCDSLQLQILWQEPRGSPNKLEGEGAFVVQWSKKGGDDSCSFPFFMKIWGHEKCLCLAQLFALSLIVNSKDLPNINDLLGLYDEFHGVFSARATVHPPVTFGLVRDVYFDGCAWRGIFDIQQFADDDPVPVYWSQLPLLTCE